MDKGRVESIYFIKHLKSEFCNGNSPNCEHLEPTEEEQDKMKHKCGHYCYLFKEKLLHKGRHPFIPRLPQCIEISQALIKEGVVFKDEGFVRLEDVEIDEEELHIVIMDWHRKHAGFLHNPNWDDSSKEPLFKAIATAKDKVLRVRG